MAAGVPTEAVAAGRPNHPGLSSRSSTSSPSAPVSVLRKFASRWSTWKTSLANPSPTGSIPGELTYCNWRVRDGRLRFRPSAISVTRSIPFKRRAATQSTHVGRATLSDGATIEPSDAVQLMTTLQYTLSFAEDRWITPVRTRGLSADGTVAWELWGLWYTAPWSMPMTWFSRRSVDGLNQVFSAIDDRWSNQYWERLLRTSMHYYLDATPGLVNRQLIMSGALLELIGWHVVVEDRKLMSRQRLRPARNERPHPAAAWADELPAGGSARADRHSGVRRNRLGTSPTC